jgi:uncharacterized caspase-like protein
VRYSSIFAAILSFALALAGASSLASEKIGATPASIAAETDSGRGLAPAARGLPKAGATARRLTTPSSQHSNRIALVIGMGAYEAITPLKNADNDATAIAQTLRKMGFDTEVAIDKPLSELLGIVSDFSFRSETADIAFVYYAGHGVEVGGENYLLPVDIKIENPSEISAKALGLKELLLAVDRARQLRIVVLDSCRNNPFAGGVESASVKSSENTPVERIRSAGLAAPSPDRGMMVVYAARDGEVALDGTGEHSPFAAALIKSLPEPDVEIGLMFRQVRDQVMAETGNRQQPHFYGSLSGVPFFLAGGQASAIDVADKVAAWQALSQDQGVQLAALADQGDTRAMLGLGYMALSPKSERYSPEKAFTLFSDAAKAGDAEATFELAKLYERGIGVQQDLAEALRLYRTSADMGFADAINDLGFFHYQGIQGLPRDPQKAIQLFQQAADLRHPQAMFNVAALIDDGVIPGKSPEDSARYLYLALRSGVDDVLKQLTENPTMFSLETRRALQQELTRNKFYDGSIDGMIGPGTQRSMRIAFGQSE